MKQGAVIFALGDGHDYVGMAAWNARRIQKLLGIPTTLITDQPVDDDAFDQIISVESSRSEQRYFSDIDSVIPWYNRLRCESLDLTPYDRTLLVDADYVVNTDDLSVLINSDIDMLCFRSACDIATGEDLQGLNHFGSFDMPMWWATVVIFNRSSFSRYVFDCWRMVRDNWQHYRNIYQIRESLFRNDYALSIALGIVSGHTLQVDEIPWRLPTLMPNSELEALPGSWTDFQIKYQDTQGRLRTQYVTSRDFHAMGKSHLRALIKSAA
jgi:hypothetical protein